MQGKTAQMPDDGQDSMSDDDANDMSLRDIINELVRGSESDEPALSPHETRGSRNKVRTEAPDGSVTYVDPRWKGPKPRCGARRKRDGQPCVAQAMASGRCKHHGGLSTGPKSVAGKIRSVAYLQQYRGCRQEMLAVADSIEDDKMKPEIFVDLLASPDPMAENAADAVIKAVGDNAIAEIEEFLRDG